MSWPSAVHVTPYGRAWCVRIADEARPIAVHEDFDDAVVEARAIASANATELVLFDESWRVWVREPGPG